MKKFLLFIFIFPTLSHAFTGETEIDGIWYHIVTKGQSAEVIKKQEGKYSGDIVIPSSITYDGVECLVTAIGREAFRDCSELSSISISSSITSIGTWAFMNCISLQSVHITDLSAWCNIDFAYSTMVLPFDFLSNPLCYAHHLFLDGEEVTNLIIPDNVREISSGAFYKCSGISSVTMANVETIGEAAFSGCNNLVNVKTSDVLSKIGEQAFYGCNSLDGMSFPHKISIIDRYTFFGCSSINVISIPSTITSIGQYAFYGCNGLKKIKMASSITAIGYRAFANCSELTDVYCLPEEVPVTGQEAFQNSYMSPLENVALI